MPDKTGQLKVFGMIIKLQEKEGTEMLKYNVVIITMIMLLPGSVFALEVQPAIDSGANWLISKQGANGGWEPHSISANNALAVRAYVATGNTSLSNYTLVLNKLKELQAPDGSWDEIVSTTSRAIWALMEAGYSSDSPVILAAVNWLEHQQNNDGGWGSYGFDSYPDSTAIAVIAIIKSGKSPSSPIIANAVSWLTANQSTDGYWGYYIGDDSRWNIWPSPALALCHVGDTGLNDEIDNAVNYLASHYYQYHDNPNVAQALEVFVVRNMSSEIQEAISVVVSAQHSDGGWGPSGYLSNNDYTAKNVSNRSQYLTD